LVVFQDVTDMRKMEERVRQSEKQAAFVRIAAGMAHEIRNPLASIRGATQLLSQASDHVDQHRLLGIVIRESDRLNALLSDFLVTVSGRQYRRERLLLSALAEQTVEQFTADPKYRNDISLELLINQGVEVEGEPAQLKQAFWNLIANAADASPRGGMIRIVLESDEASRQAVFKVQDWGSGIPPEIRDRLFEPFTTTKERGTGLGLALVLSVVEAHQGTVEVESAPGAGTLFVVRLPLAMHGPNPTEMERHHD
jgi:two-component system sensor histidine kinase PilS (NtrC family)